MDDSKHLTAPPEAASFVPVQEEWKRSPYVYRTPPHTELPVLARLVSMKQLPGIFWHKLRYLWAWGDFEPAVVYNNIVVFDRPELNGGGMTYERDILRALLESGVQRCKSACEFGCGPGYLGFSLLANGFAESMTFTDINAGAIDLIRHTARFNGIESLVRSYVSDVFEKVPASERWDLVVMNPPKAVADGSQNIAIPFDEDRSLQSKFYSKVKPFMNSGGIVLSVENDKPGADELFREMIEGGGGNLLQSRPKLDLRGRREPFLYVISQW